MAKESLKMTALTPGQVARILSGAHGRRVTEDQVRQVAREADLLRADGTLSLIEYTAWLAGEASHGGLG